MVMEHFDELVTDPTVRLTDVEAHLATLSGGDELFGGRYRVDSTSGSTGRRGLFLWDPGEWASVLTSYNRSFDWAGVRAGLTHRTRMAVVSSITPWHQSARVGASVSSLWVPTPPGLGNTASTGENNDAPFNRRWLTRLGNEGRQRWLMLLWCLSMMAAVAWIVLDVWGT
jgi:phenylacetate-coenzyme A ligase PaaK-like adenylate-forming protein